MKTDITEENGETDFPKIKLEKVDENVNCEVSRKSVGSNASWSQKFAHPPNFEEESDDSDEEIENEISLVDHIVDEWFELESDPGVFSLLIKDFGCDNVEVEEIYDLGKPFPSSIYGFIFLFNINNENRNRLKAPNSPSNLLSGEYITDKDFLRQVFFAYQKVPNSCATHSILSILMNCDQLQLGDTLTRFKVNTFSS